MDHVHIISELQKGGELLPMEVWEGSVALCTTFPTFVEVPKVFKKETW